MLNEAIWQSAQPIEGFWQYFPYDTSAAMTRTRVWAAADAGHLYLAFYCYDPLPGKFVVAGLRRDYAPGSTDQVLVNLDPFNDQTNGFHFGVSPLGVQREGLMSSTNQLSLEWDNKWRAEAKRENGYWTAEMAIPFKTLRYNPTQTWRINIGRNDFKRNESSSWIPIPRNLPLNNLAYTGELIFPAAPKKQGLNPVFIPYVAGSNFSDYQNGSPAYGTLATGADVKLAVTPSLNLDVTTNPDFSQADVDRQIINLTQNELFFPERRQFFIENSDLFSRFGFSNIRPFFSRRIGLNTRIIGGARLSGKLGRDWRIGLMTIQTEGRAYDSLASQNYTVAAVQRQVFKTSNIGFIFVNRQAFQGYKYAGDDYNRVAGLDFNLQSPSNKWVGKFFYHQSFSPSASNSGFATGQFVRFNTRNIRWEWSSEYVSKSYNAQTGFVSQQRLRDDSLGISIRRNYYKFEPFVQYLFYPKGALGKLVNSTGPGTFHRILLDSVGQVNERYSELFWQYDLQNSAGGGFGYGTGYANILYPVDFGGDGPAPLLPVGTYRDGIWFAWFFSNARKPLNFSMEVNSGTFYNASRHRYFAQVNYRWQPWGTFSLRVEHIDVQFPAVMGRSQLTLAGPEMQLAFSKKVFFTNITQYNTQAKNLNLYLRLQYRFAPMSDFFVVYSDNYDQRLNVKNRSFIVKLVYWLST